MAQAKTTGEFVASRVAARDREQMLFAALGLCLDCQEMVRHFCRDRKTTPEAMVRTVLWSWFRIWAHGNGCPAPAASGKEA